MKETDKNSDQVRQYGADRTSCVDIHGPLIAIAWSERGLEGSRKFYDHIVCLI